MSDKEKLKIAMEKHGDMIFRICLLTLKHYADAEDATQETFIVYFRKAPSFESPEHEKAWLITVAQNKCRDILRFNKRHLTEPEETLYTYIQNEEETHIIEALMSVPEKFRTVLQLHYIEGFKIDEIAEIIKKSPSAVKMRLSKGRKLLEEIYRREFLP